MFDIYGVLLLVGEGIDFFLVVCVLKFECIIEGDLIFLNVGDVLILIIMVMVFGVFLMFVLLLLLFLFIDGFIVYVKLLFVEEKEECGFLFGKWIEEVIVIGENVGLY